MVISTGIPIAPSEEARGIICPRGPPPSDSSLLQALPAASHRLAPSKITQAKLVEKNRFRKFIFRAIIEEDHEVLFNFTRLQVAHAAADGYVLCQWILNDLGGDQKHVTENSLLYAKIYHFERGNCDSGCWILRLRRTNKSDIKPYTALSYCWVGNQKPKTTKDTFDRT